MFRLVTVEDVVRIPPQSFGHPIDKAAKEQIKLKYENVVDEELGYVVLGCGRRRKPCRKDIARETGQHITK